MVARLARLHPPMECVRLHDPKYGLDGVIAIHSAALGPGAGGCRLWSYADRDTALADAVRLAEGMSYKNALAGLPLQARRFLETGASLDEVRAALLAARADATPEVSTAHPQPGRPSGAQPWGEVIARTFKPRG